MVDEILCMVHTNLFVWNIIYIYVIIRVQCTSLSLSIYICLHSLIHLVGGVSRNDATCIRKQSIEGTLKHDLRNCHCKTILSDYQIEPPRHSLGQLSFTLFDMRHVRMDACVSWHLVLRPLEHPSSWHHFGIQQ